MEEATVIKLNKQRKWDGKPPIYHVQTEWDEETYNPQFEMRSPRQTEFQKQMEQAKNVEVPAPRGWNAD